VLSKGFRENWRRKWKKRIIASQETKWKEKERVLAESNQH